MPQSVGDRPSTSLEWMIMLTKSAKYAWDQEAVRRGGAEPDRQRHERIGGKNGATVRHGEQGMIGASTSRNLRDSDWWFDSVGMLLRDEVLGFDVVSEPSSDAHYASYPRRLVRDVVLAGSSGAGVCSECGAPWVRVTSSCLMPNPGGGGKRADTPGSETSATSVFRTGMSKRNSTLGFRPSCPHVDAPRVPATILDPFCGRGTTLVVALEYGRNAIGIELSETYAAMARRRLAAVEAQPLLDVTAPEPAPRGEQCTLTMEVEE